MAAANAQKPKEEGPFAPSTMWYKRFENVSRRKRNKGLTCLSGYNCAIGKA